MARGRGGGGGARRRARGALRADGCAAAAAREIGAIRPSPNGSAPRRQGLAAHWRLRSMGRAWRDVIAPPCEAAARVATGSARKCQPTKAQPATRLRRPPPRRPRPPAPRSPRRSSTAARPGPRHGRGGSAGRARPCAARQRASASAAATCRPEPVPKTWSTAGGLTRPPSTLQDLLGERMGGRVDPEHAGPKRREPREPFEERRPGPHVAPVERDPLHPRVEPRDRRPVRHEARRHDQLVRRQSRAEARQHPRAADHEGPAAIVRRPPGRHERRRIQRGQGHRAAARASARASFTALPLTSGGASGSLPRARAKVEWPGGMHSAAQNGLR